MLRSKRDFAVHFGSSPFKSAPLGTPLMAVGLLVPVALLLLAVLVSFSPEVGGVLMAAPPLVAKRNELNAKNAVLAKVLEDAGPDVDFGKVKMFGDEDVSGLNTAAKAEKFRKGNEDVNRLGVDVSELIALEDAAKDVKRRQTNLATPITHAEPTPDGRPTAFPLKSLRQLISESKRFQNWVKAGKSGNKNPVSLGFDDVYPSEILAMQQVKNSGGFLTKTLFQTSAGWAPESTRIARVIDEPTRPIEILDVIPMERTGQASVVYMEETTRTHSAAETAEGTAYPESTFVHTEQSSSVRKIADSIPVTDEQLDDVPQVEGYLTNRLLFGVRQRLDTQVLSGDGAAPNLEGILNVSGIQTQAKDADSTPDAIYKALTKVRVTGRATPTAIILHANDWQEIRLLTTADGIYIYGPPSIAASERMWGLPVVVTSVSEGTGLVGDFANYCSLFERQGVTIEIGFIGNQFTEGEKTLRAQMRIAFVTFRPTAFSTVTGI